MQTDNSAMAAIADIPAWSEAPTQPGQPEPHDHRPGDGRRWPAPATAPFPVPSAGLPPLVLRVVRGPAPRSPVAPQPSERSTTVQPPWSVLRGPQSIGLVFGVLEALIAIRAALKLLAANPAAGFSSLVYGVTAPFVAPFQGVFPNPGGRTGVLELTSILAVIVYALLGRLLEHVIAGG